MIALLLAVSFFYAGLNVGVWLERRQIEREQRARVMFRPRRSYLNHGEG